MKIHKDDRSKNKTISQAIIRSNSSTMLLAILIYAAVTLFISYFTSTQIMKNSLRGKTTESTARIEWILQSYKNTVYCLGTMPELSDDSITIEEKINILKARTQTFGFVDFGLTDKNGINLYDNISLADRPYIAEALKGNVTFTGPFTSKSDGKSLIMVCAGPVWENGIPGSSIDSVVFCAISPAPLNMTVAQLKSSRNSTAYIISGNGQTVASPDAQKVLTRYSSMEESEKNPRNKPLYQTAKIEKTFLETDVTDIMVRQNGVLRAYSSCKIKNSPGWVMIQTVPVTNSMSNFFGTLVIMTLFGVSLLLACYFIMKKNARNISEPIQKLSERLRHASAGDFTSEVQIDTSLTDIQHISEAIQHLMSRMSSVLGETKGSADLTNIFTFFDINEYEDISINFEKAMNVNLYIYDKNMNLWLGPKDENPANAITKNITVSGRLAGKFTIAPRSNCILHHEEMDAIITTLSNLLGKILERTINREERYKAWQQNELINVNNILSRTENISDRLKHFINMSRQSVARDSRPDWIALASEAEKQISLINESTEYARFTSLNAEIHEADYSTQELYEEISDRVKSAIGTKKGIRIEKPVHLPAKLFGDKSSIERAVTRSIITLCNFNKSSEISMHVSCVKSGLGSALVIGTVIEYPVLTRTDIERLKIFAIKSDHTGETLTAFEQKILSAVKIISNMNGTFSVDLPENGSTLTVTISIPQLEAKAEE